MGRTLRLKRHLSSPRRKRKGGNLVKWRQQKELELSTITEEEQSEMNTSNEVHSSPRSPAEEELKGIMDTLTGRRIVDVGHLFQQIVQEKHGHGLDCSFVDMVFVSEKRKGFESSWQFKCKMCNKVSWLKSEDSGRNKLSVNHAAVNATIAAGVGFSQMEEWCGGVNIPCMSMKTYLRKSEIIAKNLHTTAWGTMEKAGEEERTFAIQSGNVDKEGVPQISVIADGQWSKRSYKTNYTALSGSAAIIGEHSKKVLFVGVRNKYCCVCERSKNKNIETPQHTCFMNWEKSSTSMEADIIVDGFKKSIEMHGVKYSKLIGDGDSSVTSRLKMVMPYGPDFPVMKVECRNHLLRNLFSKLTACGRNTKYPIDLRRLVLERSLKLRVAVLKASKHWQEEQVREEMKVKKLQNDIQNSVYHIFGQHDNCSTYFCNGKKPHEECYIDRMTDCRLLDEIQNALRYLASHAWSLLQDVDNNPCEQFNSVINKYIGGKRINFVQRGANVSRVEAAVIAYNSKEFLRLTHKKLTEESPGKFTKKLLQCRAKKSEWRSKRKVSMSFEDVTKKKKKKKSEKEEDYGLADLGDLPETEIRKKGKEFIDRLRMSDEERQDLEQNTRGQAMSLLWMQERRKRLTASNFGKIVRMREATSVKNTVFSLLYDTVNTKAIIHGRQHESIARERFENAKNKKVQDCGIFVHFDIPYLAATPDGLIIGEDAIVEIKCPLLAFKSTSPTEAVKEKKIKYCVIEGERLKLKKNSAYYYQVQGQLNICNKKMCYFIVYAENWLSIEKIQRNEDMWLEDMVPKLRRFYEEALLPEIVCPRFEKRLVKADIREAAYVKVQTES